MATPSYIFDMFESQLAGGRIPDQPIFFTLYKQQLLNQVRGDIIENLLNQKQYDGYDYNWGQKYIANYNYKIQKKGVDYVLFEIPNLLKVQNGMSIMYASDINQTQQFHVVPNLVALKQSQNMKFVKAQPNHIIVCYDGTYLRVQGDTSLRTINLIILAEDPISMPIYDFNNTVLRTLDIDIDDYPLSGNYINEAIARMKQTVNGSVVDLKADGINGIIQTPTQPTK